MLCCARDRLAHSAVSREVWNLAMDHCVHRPLGLNVDSMLCCARDRLAHSVASREVWNLAMDHCVQRLMPGGV